MIFTTPLILISLILLCAINIASVFLKDLAMKICNYVNIALHAGCIFLLMYHEIPIDDAVLYYMISVFVYTLAFFARYEICRARAGGKEDER